MFDLAQKVTFDSLQVQSELFFSIEFSFLNNKIGLFQKFNSLLKTYRAKEKFSDNWVTGLDM